MDRKELIEKLTEIRNRFYNIDIDKISAESALLEYLNDPEIDELYSRIMHPFI